MALAAQAHRQDVVGVLRGLAPRRGQRDVQPDLRRVAQQLDPAEPVGVGPHRVVDPREVHLERAAAVGDQVRQQERQLVHRQRVLRRPGQLVPGVRVRRGVDRARHELVPAVGVRAALARDRAEQRVEQEQRARHLPAAEVARRGAAPGVGRQPRAGGRDHLGDLAQHRGVDAGLARREVERVARPHRGELALEVLEARVRPAERGGHVLLPVPPSPDELAVVAAGRDQVVRDREEDRRLAAGLRRDPVIGVGRGVGQPHVEHDEPGAALPRLDDALRVRVEVVATLEVRADQHDHVGVGVVRARPIEAHPVVVAGAAARRADVGVRVVAVDAPAGEHALGEAVLAGPADVVHDVVGPALDDRAPDPRRDVGQRVVPRHLDPAALAALAGALERRQDAIGVGHLVERRRPLGAVASARGGVLGVALELSDLERVAIDVREQAARRLAVEAGRRHQQVPALAAIR